MTDSQPGKRALPAYPDIVIDSARNYRNHLAASLDQFSRPVKPGVAKLISLLNQVIAETPIEPANLGYVVEDMALAQEGDVSLLINDWCLGWGRDDAPIVVMGTEEAYVPCPIDLGQWNACCSVIWAAGGRDEILSALDQRHKYPMTIPPGYDQRREFHLHANDYFRVHHRRGRHTFRLVAEVIAGRTKWIDLLTENTGNLGDLAYQIEVSSYPARRASAGRDQTAPRHEFLTRLLQTFTTASVLLLHGKPEEPEWGGRDTLATTFLGDLVSWNHEVISGQAVRFDNRNGRLAVLTRALNGNVSGALLDRIHALVSPFVPGY